MNNQVIKVKINNIEQMMGLGKLVAEYATPNLVIGLNGDLGAGKTVFTKGIGSFLGIKRVINSPTFTIMKIYDTMYDMVLATTSAVMSFVYMFFFLEKKAKKSVKVSAERETVTC